MKSIAVIGAGAWGSALANVLASNGHQVKLWSRNQTLIKKLKHTYHNETYLPGVLLSKNLSFYLELAPMLQDIDFVLIAVPSSAFEMILQALKPLLSPKIGILWASKGFAAPKIYCHQMALKYLGKRPLAILSGPSFALELAQGLPTAVVIAANSPAFAKYLSFKFANSYLRIYQSSDLVGVQLGGILKNVYAVGAGICDGLGYGANARSALITRSMAEIMVLAKALKIKTKTVIGLSGLGDLVLSATDDKSRNRQLGLLLGQGKSLTAALKIIGHTVEAGRNTAMVQELARDLNIDLPIVLELNAILTDGLDPKSAVQRLFARSLKIE